MDAKLLSKIIKDKVVEALDHKNLNLDVPFMAGKLCTIENLTFEIWHQLSPFLPQGVTLRCIKLVETPRIFVEYFGE
jgi:6-pyruvoyltetrahydropterin/6-carboxytetrahydropterin synthase